MGGCLYKQSRLHGSELQGLSVNVIIIGKDAAKATPLRKAQVPHPLPSAGGGGGGMVKEVHMSHLPKHPPTQTNA